MQLDASKNQNFNMSYTTSSGKSLSFSMYDNKSLNYKDNEDEKSLSLRHQYGFSFSYEGSKLTQTDIKEIENAMKDVKPMLDNFLQNSKINELKPKELIENAMKIADVLPTPKDENHQNAIMSNLTSNLQNLINKNKTDIKEQNVNMLEDSKKLMDEILKQMQEQLQKQMQNQEEKDKSNNQFDLYA